MVRRLVVLVVLFLGPAAFAETSMLAGRSTASATVQRIAKLEKEVLSTGAKPAQSNGWQLARSPKASVAESWAHSSVISSGYVWGASHTRVDSARMILDAGGNVRAATSVATKRGKDGVIKHHATVERIVNGERVVVRGRVEVVAPSAEHPLGSLVRTGEGTFRFATDQQGWNQHTPIAIALHADAQKASYTPVAHAVNDVALGRETTSSRTTLDHFATSVGAAMYRTWGQRDFAHVGSARLDEFAARFHDGLGTALERGGRVKFDLTDVDVKRALASTADVSEGKGITAWELRQVLGSPRYRAATDFYVQERHGGFRKLSPAEERARGIER